MPYSLWSRVLTRVWSCDSATPTLQGGRYSRVHSRTSALPSSLHQLQPNCELACVRGSSWSELYPLNQMLPILCDQQKQVSLVCCLLQVTGLKGILSAPTGLESTSLVFAYGQGYFSRRLLVSFAVFVVNHSPPYPRFPDLFFTRITPSKQFDMLAEDFDYLLIAAVVLGLVVATIALSFLSSRKLLKLMWK